MESVALGCTLLGGTPAPLFVDPLRRAELLGQAPRYASAVYRPGTRHRVCADSSAAGRLDIGLVPVDLHFQATTGYPRESANGLRWAGNGITAATQFGVRARWRGLSASLAPTFSYQQNGNIEILPVSLPGTSPYAWYWRPRNIDWPQRFGGESFWWAHPGDSYIRLDGFGASLGFSSETLRWGPGRRYPLLMSGTAPGFAHAFVGTSDPVNVYLGDLFVEAVWGHLEESDFFDGDADNDTRLLAGAVASFQPRVLPGLTIGLIRAYVETIPPGGWSLGDYLSKPYSDLLVNKTEAGGGADNELFSIFFRWALPESMFEVYGEFARDDQWDGWTDDFIKEIDHSAAVMAGLQKLVRLGSDDASTYLRVAAEIVDTNFPETQRSGRPEGIFYTHAGAIQGYTHRGQLLGAPVGPSGDGQYLTTELLFDTWHIGLYGERIRFAKDIYYQALAPRYTYKGHDVELTGGVRGGFVLPRAGVSVFGDVAFSGRYNRGFIELIGPLYETSYEHNFTIQLGAIWNPASGRTGF
jgi:hypothetical protein